MTGAYKRVDLCALILGNNDDMHIFGLESPTIRGSSLICGIAAFLVFLRVVASGCNVCCRSSYALYSNSIACSFASH
jgi:hypothetical protein